MRMHDLQNVECSISIYDHSFTLAITASSLAEIEGLLNHLPVQPIDATHGLNRSAGVSYPSVFRGSSFS